MLSTLTLSALAILPQSATQAPAQDPGQVDARLTYVLESARRGDPGLDWGALAIEVQGRRMDPRGFGRPVEGAPDSALLPGGALAPLLMSAAALDAAGSDRLDLEAPIATLFPELGEAHSEVTVGHLIAHTSGLPDLVPGTAPAPEAMLASLAELPAEAEPGECFRWCPTDSLLLGLALERATERPLTELVEQRVLLPLGIEAVWADERDEQAAQGSTRIADLGATTRTRAQTRDPFGFARLRISAPAVLEFWRAYVGGAFDASRPIDAAMSDDPVQDWVDPRHGLRVHQVRLGELHGWIHGGGLADDGVHLAWYPEVELAIAIVAAPADADLPRLGRQVARAVLGMPEPTAADLPLTAARRAALAGDYQIGCNTLEVQVRGERLVLLREDDVIPLAYQGGDVLTALDDPDLRLTFEVTSDGAASSFVLDDHGQTSIATRLG